LAPDACSSRWTSFNAAWSRAMRPTRSPSRAKRWAIARPTPAEAPVMMTVRAERFTRRTTDLSMIELVRADRLGVDNGHTLRAICVARLCDCRQLQHGCPLSRTKVRKQDHAAVRKFE